MNKKIAFAAAAAVLATAAHAQSNLKGWSVGVNANFMGATTELSGGGANLKMGDLSQTVALQGAYSFDMGSKFILSVGGTYSLTEGKAGSASASGNTYELKLKDLYTLYIEPAYAISNNSLLYAKLAAASAKGEERLNAASGTETFNGTGFGAGFRHLLDKNVFVQVEFLQMNFDSKSASGTSYKPGAVTANFGLGYKF